RSAYNAAAATTTSSSSAGGHFPAMKKAKSQAVACSLDAKNGIQHQQQQQPQHLHFDTDLDAATDHLSPMIEDPNNPNDVIVDPAAGLGRVTANLSRKKATPPQPTKKLVIKLLKGSNHLSISLSFYLLTCR
ncbi:hypothetical protein U1Q18_009578, partial [Sarracenia purpurea var. burkii]